MANRIVLKRSSVANRVPLATDLVAGELAVNLTDKLLYTKDAAGNVITVGDGGGGGGSGTVTGVTATAPVVSSGGAAPVISMAAANTSTPGYLTAADWNTFNAKQAALGFTPYNATNPSGYISSITSANVTTALGYTPYNATNPNGYISSITSANVTTALGYTPYNSSNPSGYITSSALSSYLPLSGGTLTGNLTIPRHVGVNSLVLNTYATVNPSSNVFLYSQPNDRDSWIYLDSADTGSNWGIYHRQIDSAVSGLPGNSIGFVGGGNSALKAYISLADGSANFAGALTQGGNQVLHAGNYTSYSPSLTGSGASGTWGISISGNASTAYGLNVHTARNNEANKVVRTDANGYIQAGWINTDSGDNGTTAISRVYASHDGYVRYYTPANFRTVLDVPTRTGGSASGTWGISVTGTSSNITAYTINQSLGTGNGPTFDQVYVAGWFRNVGNQGLYNGTHGNHFYATSSSMWNIAGNSGGEVGLMMRTGGHEGTVRGYLYGDNSSNFGLLNSGGSWRLQIAGGDYLNYYGSSIRSYLYYDLNDTSYFLDPNSSSTLRTITNRGWLYINEDYGHSVVGVYASTRLQGVFAMGDSYKLPASGIGGGSLYGIAWSHPNAGGVAGNLNTHGALLLENGGYLCALSGSIRCRDDMRTPIYYDANDTGYYVDPNGTSRLANRLYLHNWIEFVNYYGLYSPNNGAHFYPNDASYGSWRVAGSRNGWSGLEFDASNGQQSMMVSTGGTTIGWHNNSYGWKFQWEGGRMYCWDSTYGGGPQRMLLMQDTWQGSKYFGSDGAIYGTILYDANNSGYYCDPNGTSRMGTINADALNSYGTVTAYYSDDRLKTRFSNIADALDKVCSLNGFFYVGNEVAESLGYKKKMEVGLSAQEVQRILPEVVVPAPVDENYLTIQYDRVVPLLVEAIKELRLELNQLKSLVKL
jgi:hypothetical protein